MHHLGRKLFHLFGGLGLLSTYFLLGRGRAFMIYGALIVIVLAFEIARLRLPAWNVFLFSRFGSFVRRSEEQSMTGMVPYLLGASLALYAYSLPIASAAVCFLAFGDVAATTVGERFGRTRIGQKSLEGTIAFIAASLAAGFLLTTFGAALPAGVVIFGAIVAAIVELLPFLMNDNFAIPVLSGAAMELALRWLPGGL